MAEGFPSADNTTVHFAHIAYRMEQRYDLRNPGVNYFQTWSAEDTMDRIEGADVFVVSGFWDNALLERATKLKYIQSIGAGFDQFPLDELRTRGIRLASASGVNQNAVAEHAMALMLGLNRQIHTGRDHQVKHEWRGMIGDLAKREDELIGKTLVIIGMGTIGSRLAKFAKAFDMRILATKRDPSTAVGPADEVVTPDRLNELVPQADFLALTCPLTPETQNVVDAGVLKAMKPTAYVINVARGACIDEPVLAKALESGEIAGAGLDLFWDDPMGPGSPFWDMENVIVTPHTGGETRLYEERVIDILDENLNRLWNGETELQNQIV
ncbi:MAG: D-2-hydroxyacid dehydrogenase [Dehalococcoidia bacterium]|nr:D-2-hydroxyacid dehydrogenase [Dehalococcoidia bacterium]